MSQQQQENNSSKEEVSPTRTKTTTSKLASSSKVFSCEIQPESFQFDNQTTKDVLIIFNPYPFAVSYEILSQNPEFYRFHNKGSIEPRKNVNVPILLKAQSVLDRAKQEQQLNKEEGDQSGGGLKDQMMVKLKATVKTPSKQEQSVSFKKILPVTITYLSDAPEPNQNSFMSSSAVFTTAPSASSASTTTTKPTTPLVGILKKRENVVVDESVTATATVAQSKEQESVEQEEEEEEEEEQHRWQGVMNYVSILVGAALVLLVSLSQDAVVAPTKSLFASFFIGMFAMYIQMTIQRERESRSNTTTPVVTIDSRRKSRAKAE